MKFRPLHDRVVVKRVDAESKTVIAHGNPKDLLKNCKDHRVRTFLTRGEEDNKTENSARDHG